MDFRSPLRVEVRRVPIRSHPGRRRRRGALVLVAVAVLVLLAPSVAARIDAPTIPRPGCCSDARTGRIRPHRASAADGRNDLRRRRGRGLLPGIRELPAGSRVADAIAAAGGYAADADLDAAATSSTSRSRSRTAQQVQVPRVGELSRAVPALTQRRPAVAADRVASST